MRKNGTAIDAGRDDEQQVAVAGVERDEQDGVVVDERRRERGADVRHHDEDADRHEQQREASPVELEGLGGLIGGRHDGRSVPAAETARRDRSYSGAQFTFDDGGTPCRA